MAVRAPRARAASTLERHERDEARAFAAARRALAELRELATLAPELAPRDPAELARALERVQFVSGEQPLAGAVAVVDPLQLRARRVRALFACRLQEGTFPALAGERERCSATRSGGTLAEASGLVLGEHGDALAAERYLFYAAVSRPQQLLVLSWHAASDDGTPRAVAVRRGRLRPVRRRPARRAAPASPGEARDSGGGLGGRARDRAACATRGCAGRAARAHTWSASSLELWIGCPVRWLVERLLRARDLEPDPEPLARGGLAHAVLQGHVRGPAGADRLGAARRPSGSGSRASCCRQRSTTHEPRLPPVAPRPSAGVRSDAGCRPTSSATSSTRAVRDRARADPPRARVRLRGRTLRGRCRHSTSVRGCGCAGASTASTSTPAARPWSYDYKGRSAPPAAKWLAERSCRSRCTCGATERLLGLHAAGGFYQPLTGRDLRARGVLDADGGVELECVAGRRARAARGGRAARSGRRRWRAPAAGEAARGELDPRPQTCAFEGGCAYPSICRCETL